MTPTRHEGDTRPCPDARGYSITPHGPHAWTDKDRKVFCEGRH